MYETAKLEQLQRLFAKRQALRNEMETLQRTMAVFIVLAIATPLLCVILCLADKFNDTAIVIDLLLVCVCTTTAVVLQAFVCDKASEIDEIEIKIELLKQAIWREQKDVGTT